MLSAINFYAQSCFDACKIRDVSANRMLAPKFHSHTMKSKLAP
jgi:hypothetical protein